MKEDFNNLGFEIEGLLHLTGKQALVCIQNGGLLVDVREDYEIAIKDFGVSNVLLCPYTDFEKLYKTLPKDISLILADCVGLQRKEALKNLLENGYTKVANLIGGIASWELDGLPMSSDVETMSGQCMCQIKSRKSK
ncbi:MAG: rhodanese-like domain-containing protein [Bacteroidota bacterium]